MKFHRKQFPIYTIQENGLVSVPKMADGRLIPAVVLNSKEDNELKDFLKVHSTMTNPGDVITQWGRPLSGYFKPKFWVLLVEFTKPRNFSFYIEFSLQENPALIDAIFQSRGLYVLYGFVGDKLTKRTDQDMVLIEVPDLNQDKQWDKMLREILRNRLRKQNVPKKQLSVEVEKQIKQMRQIMHFRKE